MRVRTESRTKTRPSARAAASDSREVASKPSAVASELREPVSKPTEVPSDSREVATDSRAAALESFTRAFKGANAALRRLRGRETHHPGELSYAQYGLLFGLCDGAPRSLRELALAADVAPATAAEMLDSLAAAGLVRRSRSEQDKRVVLTSLTDRGRALLDERRARYEPRWRSALAEFSDRELLTAAAILERVRAVFDEVEDEG